ncbi:ubiquinol-cytochrome c reductase iron-sulfur subunit [Flexistipes sinusarabici]|nr:ubiquinol-cytochrome c reductase iron-sulfur subunit [Flexistipes sinusarabici]
MTTKRSFIKWILACAFFIFTFKFLKVTKSETKNNVIIDLDNLSNNSVYLIKNKQIAAIRMDNNINVLSIKCTHLGCTLNVAGDIFKCPCHGSEFKLNGEVIKGPASRDLKEIDFKIENNKIIIYL